MTAHFYAGGIAAVAHGRDARCGDAPPYSPEMDRKLVFEINSHEVKGRVFGVK
jgi:hypothetical protein